MTHRTGPGATSAPGLKEFVALLAMMISLVAVSIDAMLPALTQIGSDLNVADRNDSQLIIGIFFAGLGIGQLAYGPLSDNIGRKPAIYIGLALFILGTLISLFAANFEMMLAGRFLQGLGVAGPRVVAIALVRDLYVGRAMARVMSFVMTVFILVPVLAPALGQLILLVTGWRVIFVLFLLMALLVTLWFALRMPETLQPENRRPMTLTFLLAACKEVLCHPVAMGYTLVSGLVFGAFMGYLNSAQPILQDQYALGGQFPLYFGGLAAAIGVSTITNARLVGRFGMRLLSIIALGEITLVSLIFMAVAVYFSGHPPLWSLMLYLLLVFFSVGLLFGNLSALAMEPLGHIAGIGAGLVSSLSTLIALIPGVLIGQLFDGTVMPLVIGYLILMPLALIICIRLYRH
ncbi:multidrug effflux MFS transporter [Amphritea sp. HPY]|uniref:multidrug effflux MFS transporter n=1 Tax=Amphritea sp. HPY TaxID=3421652 RepID=UPI003D7EBEF6